MIIDINCMATTGFSYLNYTPRNKSHKCTLESNVGLFCVLMCLYTCNLFVKCSYKIRFSCVWITIYTVTCRYLDLIQILSFDICWNISFLWNTFQEDKPKEIAIYQTNETRIKTYDVDFPNWVCDIKKKTQNSLIASKSSFYFKHSLNDRRRLSYIDIYIYIYMNIYFHFARLIWFIQQRQIPLLVVSLPWKLHFTWLLLSSSTNTINTLFYQNKTRNSAFASKYISWKSLEIYPFFIS
jgi:hypothetical protein